MAHGLCISRRWWTGPVDASWLARLDHARQRLLHRGGRGGARAPRPPRNLQLRSKRAIHERDLPRRLHDQCIQISMDGKGCWSDNVFVERLWRSLRYGEAFLHAYASVSATTAGIARYLTLYKSRRPHSSLIDRTPDEVYFCPLPIQAAA